MTFPTILYVFNTEVFWLPTGGTSRRSGSGYGTPSMTNDCLHWTGGVGKSSQICPLIDPRALSLVFHQLNVPHMFLLGVLQSSMPTSNANNLIYLLTVASVIVASYVCLP